MFRIPAFYQMPNMTFDEAKAVFNCDMLKGMEQIQQHWDRYARGEADDMYEDDDGGFWIDTNSSYYGELDYFLSYKGENETPMKWLYLDFNTLLTACKAAGLNCELIQEGQHFDYLAKLSLNA